MSQLFQVGAVDCHCIDSVSLEDYGWDDHRITEYTLMALLVHSGQMGSTSS